MLNNQKNKTIARMASYWIYLNIYYFNKTTSLPYMACIVRVKIYIDYWNVRVLNM